MIEDAMNVEEVRDWFKENNCNCIYHDDEMLFVTCTGVYLNSSVNRLGNTFRLFFKGNEFTGLKVNETIIPFDKITIDDRGAGEVDFYLFKNEKKVDILKTVGMY